MLVEREIITRASIRVGVMTQENSVANFRSLNPETCAEILFAYSELQEIEIHYRLRLKMSKNEAG